MKKSKNIEHINIEMYMNQKCVYIYIYFFLYTHTPFSVFGRENEIRRVGEDVLNAQLTERKATLSDRHFCVFRVTGFLHICRKGAQSVCSKLDALSSLQRL